MPVFKVSFSSMLLGQSDRCNFKFYNIDSEVNNNYKVNELYSLFLQFSALGLLQDIRNNFLQLSSIHDDHHGCYLAVKIVSNILKKAQGRKFDKKREYNTLTFKF